MKNCLFVFLFLFVGSLLASDLPTVTIEHLYYLQARADYVRKLKPDEMIEYCIAQKLGGASFDSFCAQVLPLRLELAKLLEAEPQADTDQRVADLRKRIEVYTRLLREEAQKVQNGLIREGQIAADTLQAIARAQNQGAR